MCFLDSDKKYPDSSIGGTLSAVLRVNDNSKLLSQIHSLEVREIENLIPFNYLENVCAKDINHKDGYDTLIKILSSQNCKDILFLDFKNGISITAYRRISDLKHKKFLDEIITTNGLFTQEELNEFKMAENENEIGVECLIKGLGSNVLERTMNHLKMNNFIIPHFHFEEQEKEWLIAGEKFTNWTCCGARIQ